MRFHGVCGRLVAHPLHENRLPGDTLVRNPHRSSKSTGLETPVTLQQLVSEGAEIGTINLGGQIFSVQLVLTSPPTVEPPPMVSELVCE